MNIHWPIKISTATTSFMLSVSAYAHVPTQSMASVYEQFLHTITSPHHLLGVLAIAVLVVGLSRRFGLTGKKKLR